MLYPDIRAVLDGTPIAHLATIGADGAPHSVPVWIATRGEHVAIMTDPASLKARNIARDPRVAISLTVPDEPFAPVILHGRVVGWLAGDEGWAAVDEIARKYIGQPYGRDQRRAVALIEVDDQQLGMR
jgi:PPOX class probable F420-dependent enzyme